MGRDLDDVELQRLAIGTKDWDDAMRRDIGGFDAASTSCFDETDKERMLTLIEAGCGTLGAFSARVRDLLTECVKRLEGSDSSQAEAANYRRMSEMLESVSGGLGEGGGDVELG